jgi:hypothetical protein
MNIKKRNMWHRFHTLHIICSCAYIYIIYLPSSGTLKIERLIVWWFHNNIFKLSFNTPGSIEMVVLVELNIWFVHRTERKQINTKLKCHAPEPVVCTKFDIYVFIFIKCLNFWITLIQSVRAFVCIVKIIYIYN